MHVKNYYISSEMHNTKDESHLESIRGNIREKSNDIAIGVYYRPSKQAEEIGRLFTNQLTEVYRKSITVVIGDINYLDIN